MKKITLLFLLFVAGWQMNAQSTCTQTFTVSGQDDDPTVLTINAADLNCNGGDPATSLQLINAAGSLTSGFCSSDGSSWYGFDLQVDGGAVITGCAADFNNVDITGFTTLTITSHDDDVYSDGVTITIDVEVTFTASLPPACVALTSPANGAVDITSSVITWPAAAGGATGYKLNVGTTPGGTDVLNAFDAGNVLTYNLGALASGTIHYVTVIPYNLNGDAVGPCSESNFTTCGAVSVLPWTEDFDSLGTVGTTSFPGCWTKENGGWATSAAVTYNTPRSGANYLRDSWSATDEFMWTKGFNLVGGTSYDFSVFVQSDNGDTWEVDMFQNVSASSAGATQLGGTYVVPGAGGPYGPQAYQEMRRTFVPGVSGVYYFAVRVNEPTGNPWYLAFDDFRVEVTPACTAPTGLAVNNLGQTSADISWGATSGNYEYVLDGVATDPAGSGATLAGELYNATLLTQATTYYFHVRTDCGAGSYSAWSTISFTTVATPPVNDDCLGAVALTAGAVFGDNAVVGTNLGATDTAGVADPACSSYLGSDIWFSVVVPASGTITIETQTDDDSITDTGLEVFDGSCAALVNVDCNDDAGIGFFSLLSLTATPAETLYLRVFSYDNAETGTFKISAYDASLSTGSFDMNGFSAYPNPVKDVLNLTYTKEISNVSVHNLLGQEVMTKSVNATQSKIDMSNLSTGTYLVKVTSDNMVKTIKVVKQ